MTKRTAKGGSRQGAGGPGPAASDRGRGTGGLARATGALGTGAHGAGAHGTGAHGAGEAAVSSGEQLRGAGLGFLAALLVLTQFLPGDSSSVQQGTGLILVLLWLVLAAAASLYAWLRGQCFRLDAVDLCVLGLLGMVIASALVGAADNNVRTIINTSWQWISLGVSYFLIKRLAWRPAERRALLALMVALAVGLSAFGFHQYSVSMPRDREMYLQNPDAMLAELKIVAPEGSPVRKQIVDRLESTEPIASFALTNSLATFLSVWLVVLGGMALGLPRDFRQWSRWAPMVIAALLIAGCLLLTKSRTAYLATAVGIVLLALAHADVWARVGWKAVAAGAAVLAALTAGAVAIGGLDRLVVSEAPKSMLYRLEYWQASSGMIADNPLVGVGPGTFQEHYTAYKLPQASETILEPHNVLFEIAATMGLPAMFFFLAILATAAWRGRAANAAGNEEEMLATGAELANQPVDGKPQPVDGKLEERWGGRAILVGAAIGGLLTIPVQVIFDYGLDTDGMLIALASSTVALGLIWSWTIRGRLRPTVVAIAIATLLINLLASGGIGAPGVAQTLWLLLAIGVAAKDGFAGGQTRWRSTATAGAILASLALLAFLWTAYLPVVQSSVLMAEAQAQAAQARLREADELYRRAAEVDAYSAEPWEQLAALRHRQWLRFRSPEHFAAFREAADQWIQRRPHAHGVQTMYGYWLLAGRDGPDGDRLVTEAVAAWERAVERYPNSAMPRAQLAWGAHLAGEQQRAVEQAGVALQLDKQNPHTEQNLVNQQIEDPAARELAPNAEQLMRLLRTRKDTQ